MAIIRLQQWEVKLRGGARRLLYAGEGEDLGLLDIELRNTVSIHRTKVMGLGGDEECLYDGKPSSSRKGSAVTPQLVAVRRG